MESDETALDRVPREVDQQVRAITERDTDIESLWVHNDPEPQPWGSTVYSLVESGGFIIEIRVRYYDENRERMAEEAHCVYDKLRNRR